MARYPLYKITNISGSRMDFPWIPPGGASLANNGSVTVKGDLLSQLKVRDLDAYEYACVHSIIRVEKVPAVDGEGRFQEEVSYGAEFPVAAVATNPTGAQAHIMNATCPGLLRVIKAQFQVFGGPATEDHVDGDVSREIALYNGATLVAGWQSIPPTGTGVLTAGDVVEFTNIHPTNGKLTTGSSLTVHITAYGTGNGATGYVRVLCVPYP